jgi:TonB family protein
MKENARSLQGVTILCCAAGKLCLALVLAFAAMAGTHFVSAQETTRKVRKSVQPEYPALARRFNLQGSVRVQMFITPEGKVKEVKVLGGNPLLAQAAVDAAGKWIFEPEPQPSSVIWKFDFTP